MDVILTISIYLIALNILGFASMGIDKYKAKRHEWRIPELTLFIIAFFGGSVGSILGMHLFHHKTKHWYFLYGMPAILLLQIAISYIVITSGAITIM